MLQVPAWARRRELEWGLALLIGVIALVLAKSRAEPGAGIDLRPLYESGAALRHGKPIYDIPEFVYPPFAAVCAAPLSWLSFAHAVRLWSILQVAFPLVGVVVLGPMLSRRHAGLVVAVLALVLVKSDVFVDSLFLDNPTVLFVLPLMLVAWCWWRERWATGAVILGISIAFKPLLILLLLIPLCQRRQRAAAVGFAVVIGLTAIGTLASHDLHGLLALPRKLANGTNLHGHLQPLNTSLSSVGIVHHSAEWPMALARIVLVVGTLFVTWSLGRSQLDADRLLVLTGALAVVLPVCGSLGELHYALLGFPVCMCLIAGRSGRLAQGIALLAGVLMFAPLFNLGVRSLSDNTVQVRWAVGQALVLCACIAAAVHLHIADRSRISPTA